MDHPSRETEIVKADWNGRLRYSSAKREEILSEFDRSGLSGAQFARVTGIKYQTFANWRHQRARKAGLLATPSKSQSIEPKMQWLEGVLDAARVDQPASLSKSPSLLVRLPSGVQLEVTDSTQASLAAALLRAWEKLSC